MPATFDHYAAVQRALGRLERDVMPLSEGARKTFLLGMIRSLRAAARLFAGEALTFPEKLTQLRRGAARSAAAAGRREDIAQ